MGFALQTIKLTITRHSKQHSIDTKIGLKKLEESGHIIKQTHKTTKTMTK
jgi:hypothetical protein